MSGANEPPSLGLVLGEGETKALIKARERLASALGPTAIPQLKSGPTDGDADAIAAMLHRREDSVHAVLSGTLERPVLTGREGDVARLKGDISLLVSTARAGSALPASHIEVHKHKEEGRVGKEWV